MTPRPPGRRPNVLFVLTDQQRWDTLGVFGNRDVRTPALDALAADSVRFPSTFCTHPICAPSRASILSGLYIHQHGCVENGSTLSPSLETFPRLLRQAGYRTAAVGKMHLTPTYLDVGFDTMLLAEQDGDGRLDDDYHRDLELHGLVDGTDLVDQRQEFRATASAEYWRTFGAIPSELPEEWYSSSWIGDRAVDTLTSWGEGGGNLLMVGFVKPHHPFDAPPPWSRMYRPEDLRPLPGWTGAIPTHDRAYTGAYFPYDGLDERALRRVMAQYYGSISQIDAQVARMVEVLRRRGLYDDTLVVFTSDHGEYLGFHHQLLKTGYPYDPVIRVPLLLKLPGSDAAGSVREGPVSLVDLAPTILRQAGLEPPPHMPGLDLADPAATRDVAFVQDRRGTYAARSRRHLLILRPTREESLLFDVEDDPAQLRNLLAEPSSRELERSLTEAIVRWQLFDTLRPGRLDTGASRIRRPNVPASDEHRAGRLEYFTRAMGIPAP